MDWLKELLKGADSLDQVGSIAQNLEATGLDSFAAADAAQLAESGIGAGQMTDILGQAGVADADFVAADAVNLADVNKQTAAGMGFDVAGMAKDLGKGLEAYNKSAPKAPAAPKGSIIGQPMRTGSAAPVAQPQQAIGQAAPSNAMQTIQNQNLGSVPTIQDVLKMRQLGLR